MPRANFVILRLLCFEEFADWSLYASRHTNAQLKIHKLIELLEERGAAVCPQVIQSLQTDLRDRAISSYRRFMYVRTTLLYSIEISCTNFVTLSLLVHSAVRLGRETVTINAPTKIPVEKAFAIALPEEATKTAAAPVKEQGQQFQLCL